MRQPLSDAVSAGRAVLLACSGGADSVAMVAAVAFEAERLRRAKVIAAEGEYQAATRLAEAADVMGRSAGAMQLRYLQTLLELGADQNSTVVFPLPGIVESMSRRGDV